MDFLVLWESSKNQFGRPKNSKVLWKAAPLEKVLDPSAPIYISCILKMFDENLFSTSTKNASGIVLRRIKVEKPKCDLYWVCCDHCYSESFCRIFAWLKNFCATKKSVRDSAQPKKDLSRLCTTTKILHLFAWPIIYMYFFSVTHNIYVFFCAIKKLLCTFAQLIRCIFAIPFEMHDVAMKYVANEILCAKI